MPLPANRVYTADDYWNLPDGVRAELIDGELYDMAPPSPTHQLLVTGLATDFTIYVRQHDGTCKVMASPVAVNLDANDTTWVEPDVVVVCDPRKISDRGVEGAPDLVVEVTSPSNSGMDYVTKLVRYKQAGVREYWIVDPGSQRTIVYGFDGNDVVLNVYPFSEPVPSGIFVGLFVSMQGLLA